MTELLHKELTYQIIGVYYDVYNGLSHMYSEYIWGALHIGDSLMGKIKGQVQCPSSTELCHWERRNVIAGQLQRGLAANTGLGIVRKGSKAVDLLENG